MIFSFHALISFKLSQKKSLYFAGFENINGPTNDHKWQVYDAWRNADLSKTIISGSSKNVNKSAPGSRIGLLRNKTFGYIFIDPNVITSEVIN
jgi:hypothetical protein